MGLRHSYTLIAPVYDRVISSATRPMRINSIRRLEIEDSCNVLISGIGTGLDIPHLPSHHYYTAYDLTPAMLDRCHKQLAQRPLQMDLHIADAMSLPFEDNHFDIVLMNLILAVVPQPEKALAEACRVLKPGGKIYIMDKFIADGKLAPLRRLINIFMRHIATRTDVVFEDVLSRCPQLNLLEDTPSLLGGWFRLISLEKTD